MDITSYSSNRNGAVQSGTNQFTTNHVEMDTYCSPQSVTQYDERDSNPILEAMETGRRQL
jgi:hypothetical protein